jgi:1,4-alpha-glucan branching enzyme
MITQQVEFQFIIGLAREIFRNARLTGSWDSTGHYADIWTEVPMQQVLGIDGCPVFTATVSLSATDATQVFRWSVRLDGPQGANLWGIPTETHTDQAVERHRLFTLTMNQPIQVERYYFTYLRRLGANKFFLNGAGLPSLHFAVWAPNARKVEVVFGQPDSGYISDTGQGIDPTQPVVSLTKGADDIWEGQPPGDFETYKSLPYMYRIENEMGQTVFRTDIYSRSQIGRGRVNPQKGIWDGSPGSLDGSVSCSVVIDADVVRRSFASTLPGAALDLITADEFWATEFTSGLPVATRLDDLVIYELHVGALGFNKLTPGDLSDAISFLDYLVSLGVNAVELLPMAEFSDTIGWGYGDTHHLCIESSAGGRDKYRHFVRECHRRGIAVIQDVVYNHYDPNADRAQWQYDSPLDHHNIYYWYDGVATDYPAFEALAKQNVDSHKAKGEDPDPGKPLPGLGGYLDNGSTGFTPRFWDEIVRQQFISSAAFLLEEMHVDGLRVDLTQAIHRDNTLHADSILPDGVPRRSNESAKIYGQKFLREWSRTLTMIRPTVMLIAEDHTGWEAVTKSPAQVGVGFPQGGLGFTATWFADFYHSLIGDAKDRLGLLKQAGFGGNNPLPISQFATQLVNSQFDKVVFHESHDEAGNADQTARTMVVAVDNPSFLDEATSRFWQSRRSRLAAGLSILSAGTPMFFMGEEIGAQKPYRYNDFIKNREDFITDQADSGAPMFRFYQELLTLSRQLAPVRSRNIDILHVNDSSRVLAFKRWRGDNQVLIAASWNNQSFPQYTVSVDSFRLPSGGWKEIFNSDAGLYGGANVGNGGAIIPVSNGSITITLPASGFVVLVKQ